MDPNATYSEMLAADAAGDMATARQRAQDLKAWLGKGGFYPEGHNRLDVFRKIQDVLRRTNDNQATEIEI